MSDNKKTPDIRFYGFANDWEQHKLSELINDIADGPFGSNLKTIHYTDDKEARIIQLSNITESGWQDENVRYTTFEHAEEIKRCIVHENELIMAKMMPAGLTIERPNIDKMYVLSSDAVRVKLNDSVLDSQYFVSVTKSVSFLDQINNDSQGSTRTRTSISKIKEMKISTPILQEQKKIGTFFSKLENLITLYQGKYDKLLLVKKSMVEKMFPKEGEIVPEIRFSGFAEEWGHHKAKTIFRSIADKGYPELDVLSASQKFGMIKRIATGMNVHHDIRNEIGYKRVLPGQFVIHLRSFQGGFAHSEVEGITSPAYTVLDFQEDEKHYDIFWKYFFNSEAFIKRLELITYGIRDGRSINFEDFVTLDFSYPSCEEQKLIGKYIQKTDDLILLHKCKLDKLKRFKKSMLEKMFI